MINSNDDTQQNEFDSDSAGPVLRAEFEIDITADICPMTFVRTRLALDRMPSGAVLRVRLRGSEPLQNVPRTAAAQGHAVLRVDSLPDGISEVWLRRG